MNKDWLEKVIFEKKEALNYRATPPHVWQNIEKQLGQSKKNGQLIRLNVYKIAAVFIGVLAAGILIGKIYFSESTQGVDPAYLTAINMAEAHYSKEVSNKIEIAKQQKIYNPAVASDIDELDKVYNELKAEMLAKKDINNAIIMKEMINNYKLRVSLLEALVSKHSQSSIDVATMKNDTI
jgi:hypothetical protein